MADISQRIQVEVPHRAPPTGLGHSIVIDGVGIVGRGMSTRIPRFGRGTAEDWYVLLEERIIVNDFSESLMCYCVTCLCSTEGCDLLID